MAKKGLRNSYEVVDLTMFDKSSSPFFSSPLFLQELGVNLNFTVVKSWF